ENALLHDQFPIPASCDCDKKRVRDLVANRLPFKNDFIRIGQWLAAGAASHRLPDISIVVELFQSIDGGSRRAVAGDAAHLRRPAVFAWQPDADRMTAVGAEIPRLN